MRYYWISASSEGLAGSAVMLIRVPVCAFIVLIGPSAAMNTDFIASVSQ
jgi:hypothetical protein